MIYCCIQVPCSFCHWCHMVSRIAAILSPETSAAQGFGMFWTLIRKVPGPKVTFAILYHSPRIHSVSVSSIYSLVISCVKFKGNQKEIRRGTSPRSKKFVFLIAFIRFSCVRLLFFLFKTFDFVDIPGISVFSDTQLYSHLIRFLISQQNKSIQYHSILISSSWNLELTQTSQTLL